MLMCPRCGKTGKEEEFIDSFCYDCYGFNLRYPTEETLQQCKRCKRVQIRGDWVFSRPKLLNEYIVRKCKGEFSSATFDSVRSEIVFCIKKGEKSIFVTRPITLTFAKTICVECSRVSGGYYEAIVQLRGEPVKVARFQKTLVRSLGRATFITKTEEVKGGIDIYSGSSVKTQEVLGNLEMAYTLTRKLVGRKEGRLVYRATFAIRF